ncbi:MAG: transcriptional regulator GcvA [Rhodospirillales bacterium]|jgi:LysR family transcriptional regulator, glycine cleavage system transcriptional activator|nr:transcriptional regulator GcvA [Rhodospirillales bacterium]MBT4041278.1 transcriptional regulator GcvA [Rhodospirillales bacterium]MBT4628087.1 transcriptional regulator GcvA [Rhodospirillales bacterium]MBT5351726.1 transcriptional regulator GcvA [Rhodospirillales bacterium]MBT6109500.1 transcriptional regulator GcvA [Rhodospirillales bacterium]
MNADNIFSPHVMPSLNALRAFETAARHMSFKEAAAELHVSASAIGHLIADLENFFGMKLFAREHRRIELTPAGRDLLPGLQTAFDQLRGAVRTFQDNQTDRPLVLSVEPTFCGRCLIPRLEGFRVANPDIAVRLDPSSDLMDPRIDDVDVCIRYGKGDYPGLRTDVIEDHEDIIIVCSPNLLNGDHPLRDFDDLRWHTLIDRTADNRYVNRANWGRWFEAAGLDKPVYKARLEVPWEEYAIASAIQGQGVTLASRLLATEDLAAGRLVQPFDTYFRVDMGYYLLSSEASVNDPRVEAFRDWVLDEVDYNTSMLEDGT